jgi:flagellar FliL protein
MMKKLIPLVFLLLGAGAGVGAGIFLRPDLPAGADETGEQTAQEDKAQTDAENKNESKTHKDDEEHAQQNEYAKLNNQFVVPIVAGNKVTALVVLALSVEVPAGGSETVYQREPKLRDSFLQVLFDHANMGGFEGNFTEAQVLGRLRSALKEVAQKVLGTDLAQDVLIVEIARQDY